ncbi:PaaX family transcriptional regulator [Pseudonocardia lacus]|uniref:PaaX family transcriptional regulator n=1 Tax=Pseudonocardia lacus TaxID=2835865 RepID=UPI001BDC0445|nr:PaaX family transcriptional regulator C-terminal domain-containing protein [Pseudonocardia lacus]
MSPQDSATALPRRQAGASPQHLLATLLGEYFDPAGDAVPSAALVALMGEFSVSEASARTALSRVARRGLLQAVRHGRASAYRLTPEASSKHKQRMQHFLTFGAAGSAGASFSGEWTVVAFSVAEEQRSVRATLRRELQALRFGRLFDSVWVRPGDHTDAVRAVVADVSRGGADVGASVMLSRFAAGRGVVDPLSAFDLAGLGADYAAFTARFAPLRARTRDGAVPPAEALVARTELMDTWRAFTDTDPDLPAELLPAGWERDGARRTFLEIHTGLGPLAEQRLRQIVARYSAEAAEAVRHYSAD